MINETYLIRSGGQTLDVSVIISALLIKSHEVVHGPFHFVKSLIFRDLNPCRKEYRNFLFLMDFIFYCHNLCNLSLLWLSYKVCNYV